MNTISIGGQVRSLRDATPQWIHDQFQSHGDAKPCVIVRIHIADIQLALNTPNCHLGGSGGRGPNQKEKGIFDLWNKLHLDEATFAVGNVIAFVQQVTRLI